MEAYEILKDMYKKGRVTSFSKVYENKKDNTKASVNWKDFEDLPTPSWEYFYEAEEEAVPKYRVELAKSGRSTCRQTTKSAVKCRDISIKNAIVSQEKLWTKIPKGDIRIGSLLEKTGTYSRWVHLRCWRVPSSIWLGLPDPSVCHEPRLFLKALIQMDETTLVGLSEMPEIDQMKVVEHVMIRTHWAKLQKRRKKKLENGKKKNQVYHSAVNIPHHVSRDQISKKKKSTKSIVLHDPTKRHFVIPKPGGASDANSLQGKTFVLTGTFPEVGGGAGLTLGKGKVKRMIQSFGTLHFVFTQSLLYKTHTHSIVTGGRVTNSVSGKTDFLVVGKSPGFSKVSKGRKQKKCRLVSLKDVADGLHGGCIEDLGKDDDAPMLIKNFSKGYGGNSLANHASQQALAIASGTSPALIENRKKTTTKKKRKLIENNSAITPKKMKIEKKEKTNDDLFQAYLRLHNLEISVKDLKNGRRGEKLLKKHYVALLSSMISQNDKRTLNKIRKSTRSVLQNMFWSEIEQAKLRKGSQIISTTQSGTSRGKIVKFLDRNGNVKSRYSTSVVLFYVQYENGEEQQLSRSQIRRKLSCTIKSLSF